MATTGTPLVIGFIPATQRPIEEYYLNETVAWTDEAEALSGIPLESRSDGMTVKIGLVEYWFLADLTTLELKSNSNQQTAVEVPITDAGDLYDATEVETALQEVMSYANTIAADVAALAIIQQVVYTINFTEPDKSVAARVSHAIETEDYPTGWTLAANLTYNLLITHTLTRKLAAVNIFEIDGTAQRLLVPFSSSFTGVLCDGYTILIEGIAPVDLAVRIELIFA